MVLGDSDRLQQVVWNLVSNAVKFTPRGGSVEVWIGRVGTGLHLRVSDTGHGITRDFLPHVFERFRQGASAPSRRQGGLGLGLSIVKQLVELHGGTVEADSPGENKGATFVVAFPIPPLLMSLTDTEQAEVLIEPTASEKAWTALDRTMLEGIRLLVVEDEADSREMLATAFAHCGAHVSTAASASEAMEVLERATPDVLVCDVGLPGEDGQGPRSTQGGAHPGAGTHGLFRAGRSREGSRGGFRGARAQAGRSRRAGGRGGVPGRQPASEVNPSEGLAAVRRLGASGVADLRSAVGRLVVDAQRPQHL
jgi:hypothetical protein